MPMWNRAPSSLLTSSPLSIEMTGIPAATAARIESPNASASGIETTRPSGLVAMAASISCAMATMSKVAGAWYWTIAPILSPPASTPFLTTDQKGSDAWPWVMNMMRAGPSAWALPAASPNARTEPSKTFVKVCISFLPGWFLMKRLRPPPAGTEAS